nr:hypothetical protein [Pseudomonadota bacterium]
MKKVLLLGFLICMTWSSPTLACTVNGKDWAGAVNGVLEAFKSGKYQDVNEIIKENIRVENGQEFQKLVSDLEEYEPDGFDKCRIFMREELPPIVEKLIFQFIGTDGNGIFVYLLVVDGGREFKSGIQILRVSTDIEDILKIWSNS